MKKITCIINELSKSIIIILFLIGTFTLSAQTVWLDELDLSAATQGYGIPMKNKSNEGKTFTIAGENFERGFGTHAVSSLMILLEGKAVSFSAKVGLDDEVKGHEPAVEFELYGDGKKLWSSGLMKLGDATRRCLVTLYGVQKLELMVADGGNGNYWDHANWVDAKFEASYGNVINGLPDNDPYKVSSLSYNGGGELATAQKPFKVMSDYLREQPRDIVYSLCQYGMSDVWKWGGSVGGSCWRTTNDITDTWVSVKNIALDQDKSAAYAKPGNWNDPDMLVVGHVGWGNTHPSKLKPDEQYLHISLWSLFAAPLLIGCDMEKLDDFTLNLLTNDEVIEVNQDPLGKQATCVQTIGDLRIYVKELEDGSRAVGFCNFGVEIVDIAYNNFEKLGINGKFKVRDLWRQTDISNIVSQSDKLDIKVPAHGVLLYKFSQSK